MILIPPLVSDLVKSVWSAPSISVDVLALSKAIYFSMLQVRFSQEGSKSLPKLTSENLKNIRLEDRYLAGGHF